MERGVNEIAQSTAVQYTSVTLQRQNGHSDEESETNISGSMTGYEESPHQNHSGNRHSGNCHSGNHPNGNHDDEHFHHEEHHINEKVCITILI